MTPENGYLTLLATLTDLYAHVGDGEVEPPLEPALLPDVEDLPIEGRGARRHTVVAHYPTLQKEHRNKTSSVIRRVISCSLAKLDSCSTWRHLVNHQAVY